MRFGDTDAESGTLTCKTTKPSSSLAHLKQEWEEIIYFKFIKSLNWT